MIVWPADSGPLFDALKAAPATETVFLFPGTVRLDRDDPGVVFEWWSQQRGEAPDELLAWIVRNDPDSVWDGKTP